MSVRVDYAPHFAAIEEAKGIARQAEAALCREDNEMRRLAQGEATKSLAAAGVVLKETLLTVEGRRSWDRTWSAKWKPPHPILIEFVSCGSAPSEASKAWYLQVHYSYARKDGKPNKARNSEITRVACDHPSDFGAAVLERFPIWSGKP